MTPRPPKRPRALVLALEAAHWACVVFAGKCAVFFLMWAFYQTG